ncbi:MAG TPA: 3-phosphoshikimate 1-carboxyvinyltransferase [Bacteroidales bacterium]|nr:3-phosphoshikimate 1-carboxyvinyltransferase [Bacteroidales bacterium]HNX84955.1 3-phosphoshikimate 1-carboxyvinyltransferase [Bacteroidales bacterium]HOC48251.1 3-phosphoshikimate 1-carboxyvinyltransferase [Bacteroidales bacterium]HPS98584.1 3-phosphoshikimate 1-carboxyvinyltransferase [Bacteroidales bacterium]
MPKKTYFNLMNNTVNPSGLAGLTDAPPSKSLTQRAIAAGLLSGGTTVIRNASFCNDSMAAINMAQALGATIMQQEERINIIAGIRPAGPVTLNCGESGLALRMFAPVAGLLSESVTFTGEGSLVRRPVTMIREALIQLGVKVETSGGLLPLKLSGRLRPGRAFIDGSSGSQLLTGLLMALPMADGDSRIDVASLTSKPYIGLTLGLLAEFGIKVENDDYRSFIIPGRQSYRAHEYTVEGDWSGAAFLLVAGATAGRVTVDGLNPCSLQADRAVLQALEEAGAGLITGPCGITASRSELKAFTFEATDAPDLFPPLAALAARCEGTSRITGVGRLRHKESDRAEAIAEVLGAMGIRVRFSGNEMLITGGQAKGATVSSHNDHRIAMMAAVMAASAAGPVTIAGAEAVSKSYPGFYDDLTRLGAVIS